VPWYARAIAAVVVAYAASRRDGRHVLRSHRRL